jgi:hypothetical protein
MPARSTTGATLAIVCGVSGIGCSKRIAWPSSVGGT